MNYPKDSFYTNFGGAYMSKDRELTKDLIFNEVAFIVATRRKEVIAMLKEVGVKFSKKPTDKEIVSAIIDNLGEDRRIDIGISYLISEKNKEFEQDFSNIGGWFKDLFNKKAENTQPTSGATPTVASGGSTVGAIATAIGNIFGFAKSVKEGQTQKEADKQALLQKIIDLKAAKESGKGGNTALYVILGLVVVGGLIGVYLYMKSTKAKANLGGDIKVIK